MNDKSTKLPVPAAKSGCPDNRVPGQIMEKVATGSEFFDQYPPTGDRDIILEIIRACTSHGLSFLQSEVSHERFKAPDGHQYARYVFDITMATRAGYRWGHPLRHSVEVPFRGEGTSYRAKKLAMRDCISLLFGVELPFEPEAIVRRGPPTAPACTGKESAARKFAMLEDIELIATPTALQEYAQRSRQQIKWLWRGDRPEIAAAIEQRAKQLSKPAQIASAAPAAQTAAHRLQKATEGAE